MTRYGPSSRICWPLLAACLALALLSVRNTAQALFARSDPALAARFWPADGDALAALAYNRVVASGGAVDATSVALARNALSRSPRSALPLVVMGLGASAGGDLAKAQAFMEAARARDPRSDTARFWLLDHYMRTGQYAAGLDEIAPAMSLRAGTATPLMNLVGALAATPAAHRAVLEKLARQPPWRAFFFQQEAGAALPPGTMLSLLLLLPANSDPEAARIEQQAAIGALVAHGDYAEARGAWESLLPPQDRPAPGIIYDPDFRGLPGAAPFNWTLQPQSDVSVTRGGTAGAGAMDGLTIAYRAPVPRPIGSEIVPVPAGSYRLALEARRIGAQAATARIVATVSCVADDRLLASLPLDPLPATPHLFQADLVVPPSCPFASIALSGKPSEIFEVVSARIGAVHLIRRR